MFVRSLEVNNTLNLSRRVFLGSALVVPAALLTACGGPSTPSSSLHDFEFTVYQGDGLLGGRQTTLSRVLQQGKPVVLNFWAGLCPPCRAEMPSFQRAAAEHDGKVTFLGVDVGPFTGLGSHDDARRLLAELQIRYPAGYALDDKPLRQYQVRSMPTTLFLTPKGEIVWEASGMLTEGQLHDALDKLLAATS
jgi:thiol-disulfide isomerase/thioredoxin